VSENLTPNGAVGPRLNGKVALVTGASRGIGLAIAQRLVAEGAQVCVTGRKPEPLAEAVRALGGPAHAIGIAGHADDVDHQAATVAAVIETFGSLDVLVNNTGINPTAGPLMQADMGALRKLFEVNLFGTLSWVQHAHRAWLDTHGGSIINVASIAGLSPAAFIGAYGVSKAAVIHLTKQLAYELAPNIRVNAVAPAVVKTRFATALFEGREEQVSKQYALGRLGVPDDVAGAVAFLASDDASWVTGQTMVLDGGLTLAGGMAA
jgi:3-oxoacyl-[acyl-carrier protein] reductase